MFVIDKLFFSALFTRSTPTIWRYGHPADSAFPTTRRNKLYHTSYTNTKHCIQWTGVTRYWCHSWFLGLEHVCMSMLYLASWFGRNYILNAMQISKVKRESRASQTIFCDRGCSVRILCHWRNYIDHCSSEYVLDVMAAYIKAWGLLQSDE